MELNDIIDEAAQQYGVDPSLISRIIQVESGGDVNAVSEAGAIGPMQLMPGTAEDLGVDPSDPRQNILGGTKYIADLIKQFGGDVRTALAGYNEGPGGIDSVGYDYADKVLGSGGVNNRMINDMGNNSILSMLAKSARFEDPDEPLNTNLVNQIMGQTQASSGLAQQQALSGAVNFNSRALGRNYKSYQMAQPMLDAIAKASVNAAGNDATMQNASQNKTDVGLLADAISQSKNSSNKSIYAGIAQSLGVKLPTTDPNYLNGVQVATIANDRQKSADDFARKQYLQQQQFAHQDQMADDQYKKAVALAGIRAGTRNGAYGKYKMVDPESVDASAKKYRDTYSAFYNATNDPNSSPDQLGQAVRWFKQQQAYLRSQGRYQELDALDNQVGGTLAKWMAITGTNNEDTPDNITDEQLAGNADYIYGQLVGDDPNIISNIMGQ